MEGMQGTGGVDGGLKGLKNVKEKQRVQVKKATETQCRRVKTSEASHRFGQ